jgi:hypothetical protein
MDDSERLRLEYDGATDVVRSLTEVRSAAVESRAVGLLRATATAGVLVHELRNAQIRGLASILPLEARG